MYVDVTVTCGVCQARCMLVMRFERLMAIASWVRQLKLYSGHWSVTACKHTCARYTVLTHWHRLMSSAVTLIVVIVANRCRRFCLESDSCQ